MKGVSGIFLLLLLIFVVTAGNPKFFIEQFLATHE
jgi:hypothetical protein